MTVVPYDEDRLPWLEDGSEERSGRANGTQAVPSSLPVGVAAGVILLGIGAAIAIGVFLLLGWGPNGDSRPPTAIQEDRSAALETVCAPICSRQDRSPAPSTDGVSDVAGGSKPSPVELQLGAYRSQATARSGWDYLSGRFPWLRPYRRVIVPPQERKDGLLRLRLLVPTENEADGLCERIKGGGEECFLVRPAAR